MLSKMLQVFATHCQKEPAIQHLAVDSAVMWFIKNVIGQSMLISPVLKERIDKITDIRSAVVALNAVSAHLMSLRDNPSSLRPDPTKPTDPHERTRLQQAIVELWHAVGMDSQPQDRLIWVFTATQTCQTGYTQ